MIKTAVLVRGQARTWNYIAENNISLINKTYDNPDWFLVFPETTTVTEESIKNNFKDSNLISIQFVKDENYKLYGNDNDAVSWRKFPPAYFRQAFLEYHAGRTKRRHEIETGKRYNRVLAIRPDSYFFPDIVPSKHPLEDQDLIGFSSSPETTQDLTGADFQFLAGHRAADLMSFRYLDSRYTDGLRNQALHPGDLESPQYYIKKNLIMQPEAKRGILSSRIVRPNQIAVLPTLTQVIAHSESYLNDIADWDTSSVLKKIKWCEKYQIDPQDYFLKRDFTKIS